MSIPHLVLISCGKSKLQRPARADAIYTGSLFRAQLKYADHLRGHVMILSSKYGLLDRRRIVVPYELTLNNMTDEQRDAWAERVAKEIMEVTTPTTQITLLASKTYSCFLPKLSNRTVTQPFEGLSLGQRLAAVKLAISRGKNVRS